MMRWTPILIFLFSLPLLASAQDDPILFSVGNEDVKTSEFLYIYNKNNGVTANYNKSSINEYLELYKNFKLKVYHARQMKMDTIQRLKTELNGYREQLAATYLNDNGVMGKLASEAYARMLKEVEVSHILINIPKAGSQQDTTQSYNKAMEIYNLLINGGMTFEELARLQSHDAKTKNNGGYIGFIKAILPRGYYNLESAIYKLVPGNISKPVRSPRGYHIVKSHSIRSAREEVEIAQILIKKNPKTPDHTAEKQKIDAILTRLKAGEDFAAVAAQASQDESTKRKGGRIGYIKTGAYDEEFEEAAFGLTLDGQLSEPIETRVGFHILKRLGAKKILPFSDAKRRIETELRRTERENMARDAMIDRIKVEEGFTIQKENRNSLFASLDQSIFSYRWDKPENIENLELLSFSNGMTRTSSDFINYLSNHPKDRVQLNKESKDQALHILFDSYVNDICLQLEKSQLEKKYPEFAAIMREYEEGILLFEITKKNVWDKASSDTVGLKKYFNAHRSDYQHPQRINVTTYTLAGITEKQAKKRVKQIRKKSDAELLNAYPKMAQEKRMISRDGKESALYIWKVGKTTELKPLGESGNAFQISKTNQVIPPRPKELKECRGYVIAHYQEALEKSWIKELKEKYVVKENQAAINKIIK